MRNLRTNLLIFIYHEIMEKKHLIFSEKKIMANLHQRIAFDSLFMSLSLH